jgi:predicted metalloprotease with PDZ domain
MKVLLGSAAVGLALASASLDPAFAASPGPQPSPAPPPIAAPQDTPYAGTIELAVDARNVGQHIFDVHERVPISGAGDLVLLYPQWIPGSHAPTGHLDQFAGLTITANGQPVAWRRDPVNMWAFHVDAPDGATELDLHYQVLSAGEGVWPRVSTPGMLDLDWSAVTLYPAGYFARQITYHPSIALPAGWSYASALDGAARSGDTVSFAPVSLELLNDSPVLSARYMKTFVLKDGPIPVRLDVAADEPGDLEASPEQIAAHKALIAQAEALFGARHYNHYDFLLWLSDQMSGKGREHMRSSEDGLGRGYFTDKSGAVLRADLLSHEFSHSWNGKFRRPADLWTANYNEPMRNSLLWVYEGQTQYWGAVLAGRAGLRTPQEALDALAVTAADMEGQVGRSWRPLADTQDAPIIAYATSSAWDSWARSGDYYPEGQLIWLDVDMLIRERSHGRRSLDDFAKAFFGVHDGSQVIETYSFDDVVAALNRVEPYDWASFLQARLQGHGPGAPLDGLARGGYRLVYTETPSAYSKASEAHGRVDLGHSLGLTVGKDGRVDQVAWDSPAFQAGLVTGSNIVAVNGAVYDPDRLKAAVTTAKATGVIDLIVKSEGGVAPVQIKYKGGLKYPHLERIAGKPALLDQIFRPIHTP